MYEIVSDCGAYSQWIAGLKSSELLARESNFAIVSLGFYADPDRKLTVECVHAPTRMVVVRSLSGHRPAVKIEWKIQPGEVSGCIVSVKLTGPLSYGFLFGRYRTCLDPKRALYTLSGIVASYEEVPAEDKILEIMETEEGLICQYRGTNYRMKANGGEPW